MMSATTRTSTESRQVNWSDRMRSNQFIDRLEHLQKIDGLAHVVNAHDRGAAAMRRGNRRQRSRHPIGTSVAAGEMSDEFLPRGADDQRRNLRQFTTPRENFEIVIE